MQLVPINSGLWKIDLVKLTLYLFDSITGFPNKGNSVGEIEILPWHHILFDYEIRMTQNSQSIL